MQTVSICHGCKTEVPADAPFGHCPRCVLSLAFAPDAREAHPSGEPGIHAANPFGGYELLARVGSGGMGVVYKARHIALDRTVALKMISSGELATPAAVQRFRNEAEAAAKLDHPNIVPLYEIAEWNGQHYFTMKLIQGQSLEEKVKAGAFAFPQRDGGPNKAELIRWEFGIVGMMAQIARAVHYAHQNRIIHRDLKPGNVLVDLQGRPHLIDFGLAASLEREDRLTKSHDILGTPSFMAPEQAVGNSRQVTTSADIYSLGAIFYLLLVGQTPFSGGSAVETLRAVVEKDPPHPHRINCFLDNELVTICLKCLDKNPARRYGSAEALADDLERWLRREPILARPATMLFRARRWVQRHPSRAVLLGTIVAFLIIANALLVWGMERGRRQQEAELRAKDAAIVAKSLGEKFWRLLTDKLETMWRDPDITSLHITSEDRALLRGELITPVASAQRFTMGMYTRGEPTIVEHLAPLLDYLEKSMSRQCNKDLRVDFIIFEHHTNAQIALLDHSVDFLRIGDGPLYIVRTNDRAILPLVQQKGGKAGAIVVLKNSPIKSVADLKGKRLALGSKTSTSSGFRIPHLLSQAGLSATNLALTFHKNNDESLARLRKGEFDAVVARLSQVERDRTGDLRVIKSYPSTPMPWVARGGLNPDIIDSFVKAMVDLHDTSILNALPDDAEQGFEKVADIEQLEFQRLQATRNKFFQGSDVLEKPLPE